MIDDDSMMMIMVQYRAIVRSGDDEHENQNLPSIENNQRFDASQLKAEFTMGPSCPGPGRTESKIPFGYWADWALCRNGVTGKNVGKEKTNEKTDGKR